MPPENKSFQKTHQPRPLHTAATPGHVRPSRPDPSGLAARKLAVALLAAVIERHRAFDEALAKEFATPEIDAIPPRDRALARLIAATVLRRYGELSAVIRTFLDKPLPDNKGHLWLILLSGTAQLLVLGTPPHAAISLAVEQCRADRGSARFDKLANAVLRRVADKGPAIMAGLDGAKLNIPSWLWRRWVATYGEDTAKRIAEASLSEACLDISVKSDAEGWAKRLGGVALPAGSVRLDAHGRIEDLDGYHDGAWWVQDAAAAFPARLLGNVEGLAVADLCAAPGGKTAELASAGARVTAVDGSATRLERLAANLIRLKLEAEVVVTDAAAWAPGRTFDAVLVDVPCTATGTIRRHPDILHLKRESDLEGLATLQGRLLDNAARLVKPGGLLVYCSCSLEPEEGSQQISRFLDNKRGFTRVPITPGECGIEAQWISAAGDLRTLPIHAPGPDGVPSGMDGFFAARLERDRQ